MPLILDFDFVQDEWTESTHLLKLPRPWSSYIQHDQVRAVTGGRPRVGAPKCSKPE